MAGIKEKKLEANAMIAGTYYEENDFSNAEHYYQVCVRLSAEIKDSTSQANAMSWIGHIYFFQDKLDAALLKYQEGMKLIRDTIGYYKKGTLGNLYVYLGDLYQKLGANAILKVQREVSNAYFSNALTQYQLGITCFHAGSFEEGVVFAYVPTGELLLKMNRIEEAKSYLEKALVLSKASCIADNIRDSYRGIVSLDSAEGNYKKAFQEQKMYLFYRDSLNNISTAKLSTEYSMQYEAGKRDAIARLEEYRKEAEIQHTLVRHYFII